MIRKHNLAYYVYIENINKCKIEKYNVLNDGIIKEILERTKASVDKKFFAEQVKLIIMHYYWARSEWEIVLTDWPTHIKPEELARLSSEQEKYQKDRGHPPYLLTVNLTTKEKIDVYDQVMLNWDIFIDYLWENLKGK